MAKYIFMLITIAFNFMMAQTTINPDTIFFSLNSVDGLELINVQANVVNHMDKSGIQVSKIDSEFEGGTLVVFPEINFTNGTIEIELTGEPAADADPQMRGFVGLAFRVNPSDYSSYECFYLRPTNARAENQLQRNHSTQYVSHPEYPWYRLRKEHPGMYESYVDLVPGEWTRIKIIVSGLTAKLFIHDSDQPSLIVTDLRHPESVGKIALWMHSSTLARFRNLIVTTM